MTGKRVYHLDKDRIGEYFVGGDDVEIYQVNHILPKPTEPLVIITLFPTSI